MKRQRESQAEIRVSAKATLWKWRAVENEENQTAVFQRFPPPLEIAEGAISTFPQGRRLLSISNEIRARPSGACQTRSKRRFSTKGPLGLVTYPQIPRTRLIDVSDGKRHDVYLLDEIVAEPGAFYVMDRAYLDFKRLHTFHRSGAFFVTRTKTGVVLNRRYSHAVPPDTGVTSDQTVVPGTAGSARNYPDTLRRIRFVDPEKGHRLIFLTNNFDLPALTVAQLYKSRWRIELFFKWIKQHLRIKAFYGTSENAVKTQIWIAVASYVLIAILKKRLLLGASLHEILQVLSLNLFEKTPILQACGEAPSHEKLDVFSNQLSLLDL